MLDLRRGEDGGGEVTGEKWAGDDPRGVRDDGAGDITAARVSTDSSGLGVGRVQRTESK